MYKNMAQILKPTEIGDFKLSTFEVKEDDFYARFRYGIPVGKYVRLTHHREVVMSNTPMEKRTNYDFIRKAHGNVLIGGLGIGMIVLAIQDNPDVDHITVVEKHKEVVEMVASQLNLNSKVDIVMADVFDYKPADRYNTIYMDIWSFINSEVYEEEMKPLIYKYRRYLVPKKQDPESYVDCWCKTEAKKDMMI